MVCNWITKFRMRESNEWKKLVPLLNDDALWSCLFMLGYKSIPPNARRSTWKLSMSSFWCVYINWLRQRWGWSKKYWVVGICLHLKKSSYSRNFDSQEMVEVESMACFICTSHSDLANALISLARKLRTIWQPSQYLIVVDLL